MKLVNKTQEDDGQKVETILTFEASAEEVDAAVESVFAKAAENDIPGFRRGHVPREVLIKNMGGHDSAYGAVAEHIVNELGFAAIDDNDVLFISDPEFNVPEQPADHHPFTFTVSGDCAPTVQLSSIDPVTIDMPPEDVTEEEIDNHIERLREYYYTFETVDRPAQMGDYVMLNLTCSTQGHNINGLTNTDRLVGLGEGTMPAAFDEHVVGAETGFILSFDFEAEQSQVQFNTDGTVHVEAVVKEVRARMLPDLDDDFAKKLGAQDVNALKGSVKNLIGQAKKDQLPQIMEDRCIEAVAQRFTTEIPQNYIEFIRSNVLADMFQEMQKDGMEISDFLINNNIKGEQIKEQAEERAKEIARKNIALDSLFAQAGMELTDEDLDREFAAADDPEGMRKQWEEAHNMALFRQACKRNKATNWLIKTAEVNVVDELPVTEVK